MTKLWLSTVALLVGVGSVLGLSHRKGSFHVSHRGASSVVLSKSSGDLVHYPTNAHDQTYGADVGPPNSTTGRAASALPYRGPELVLVQATNGKTGYAYASQLNGPMPKSPQQAIAMNAQYPRTIPVYARNGTTVIGKFVIGGGTVTTSTSPDSPAPRQ